MQLLIQNAILVDGSGAPAFPGSVGVENGKILLNPAAKDADTVIDAAGRYLCPGFIDAHSHGDQILGQEQAKLSKVSQGITTEITGMCGGSMFPVAPERLEMAKGLLSIGTLSFPEEMREWTTAEAYFKYAETVPLAANMRLYIGHTTLRIAVMGFDHREATAEELEKMKALVRGAMEQGAMGLSTGLIYSPAAFASRHELVELCRVVAEYGGFYATHMRNESDKVVQAVAEALDIGRQSGAKVWISHHKMCGKKNWGQSRETLRLIEEARAEGVNVTVDHYPYTANMTNLNIPIPPKYFDEYGIEGVVELLKNPEKRAEIRAQMEREDCGYDNFYQNAGGWNGILVSGCPDVPEADGMTVAAYAAKIGKDPFEAYFDIIQASGSRANGIYFTVSDEDLFRIVQNPNACVGTDGSCRSMTEKTHPRTFGTFPRAICWYHKEKKLFSLEEIIRKLTFFPAERAHLTGKGLIRDGYDADLLLFDYDRLKDTATYTDALSLCDGIDYVIVNGEIVYHDKKLTGANPGRLLRFRAGRG